MVTTCAVCIAINRNLTATLLPTTVTYRGYSLCIEHLRLWEANREAEWAELVELAEPVKVLKVDLSALETDEEKHDALLKAVEDFEHSAMEPLVSELHEIMTETATDFELESVLELQRPGDGKEVIAEKIREAPKSKRGRPKGKKNKKKGAKK